MPMRTVTTGLPVCDCCALANANADTSGCEHYCSDGHVDRLCQWGLDPGEDVVPGDAITTTLHRCFGCGEDAMCSSTVSILAQV